MKRSLVLVFCALALFVAENGVAAGKFGFGKIFKSKPKPPRTDSYPKQRYEPHDARPPPYNPSYGGPPPPYSKNPPPYPQHGGNAQPPPYGWNPGSQGNPPSYGWNPGAGGGYHPSPGGYNSFPGGYHPSPGGYNSYPGGYNNYPGSYSGSRTSGFGGIVPIPIPIPLGGGGFGYPGGFGHSSFGGSSHRGEGSSSSSKDNKEPPRVLAPVDGELEGVTELPSNSGVPQWTLFAKEISKDAYRKRLTEAIE